MNLCPICRDVRRFARQTVYSVEKRFQHRGHVGNFSTRERPKETPVGHDETADPRKTATDIHRILKGSRDLNMSARTAQRRLASFGLHGRHGVKKPLISMKNGTARLGHLQWTTKDWPKLLLFNDEGKFQLLGSDGARWVSRRKK